MKRDLKIQLSPQLHRYLDQLLVLGYGATTTDVARYLIDRGIDDLLRSKIIGLGQRAYGPVSWPSEVRERAYRNHASPKETGRE